LPDLGRDRELRLMRLHAAERKTILNAVLAEDSDVMVYLFGSQVDDAARGGDIDLLALSKRIDVIATPEILAKLHEHLGDQRIDLAVYPDFAAPFARLAVKEGMRL